jgi:type I restriction enzyme R subunit
MPSQTNEQALESAIEQALTGISQEEMKERSMTVEEVALPYGGNAFRIGWPNDFNAEYAIDETRFWHFLETTQPEELEKLQRSPDWKLKILQRFDRMVKKYGLLRLLRRGLDVEDAHFTLFYELPLASSGQAVRERFEQNEFSVMRQVRYNLENPRQEIDMVIFLNGLPLATLELKNPWTGQRARIQGIKQYKEDRDNRQPLLQFGRCIVHFAVDTDEAYMTTKLDGKNTFFLPFNKGHNDGAGNPPNPGGHKTAYLWREVFTRQSLANILQHFVRFDGKAKDPLSKRTLFFPRYHQMDVVRQILAHAARHGVGQRYLIQHSAGSGKSNSITWAAYQLIDTYPEREGLPGARGLETPLFDSVIVVTDRRLLDKQLRDNIKEFSVVKNIVAPAHSARELRDNLEQGKRIIITTIQKFPFIINGIQDLSDKRFAVVIDEAHSSQSGTTAGKMNMAMTGGEDPDLEDTQDKILQAIKGRKMSPNASYLAFTATPKNATLERFGIRQENGSFRPFHLYSMKQAIQEGFILDVLVNYTTYKSYYELEKSIEENPEFETTKAQKKLRAYVERDKRTIATKAEIMMDHFIDKVFRTRKLKGKAKGMVITQNIESAIRYFQAIREILDKKGNPFKAAIAFSGKKKVDGVEHTEASMNGFPDKDTKDKFDEDDYRILVVANKYLTGFDQPKLCTMYVDKKLQGVLAVQALSRLNRSANKYGKKSEDLFVLDFFNDVEDIKKAFDPYYTVTSLEQATDVNVLHEIKGALDEVGVYEWAEVESFTEQYFNNVQAEDLSPLIDRAAERFNEGLQLEDDEKADFKIKAKQFVKIYSQVSSIIPYERMDWEQLFWFLKFLIPKLLVRTKSDDAIDELLESVDLSTYGLERTRLNHTIGLDDSETELDPQNPNPRGAHGKEEEKDPLDEIIRAFNDRFYTGWEETPEEARVKFVALVKNVRNHPDFESKVANNADTQNSDLALKKILDDLMLQRRKANLEEYKRYRQDEAYYQGMFDLVKRLVARV